MRMFCSDDYHDNGTDGLSCNSHDMHMSNSMHMVGMAAAAAIAAGLNEARKFSRNSSWFSTQVGDESKQICAAGEIGSNFRPSLRQQHAMHMHSAASVIEPAVESAAARSK